MRRSTDEPYNEDAHRMSNRDAAVRKRDCGDAHGSIVYYTGSLTMCIGERFFVASKPRNNSNYQLRNR
jgi:hypothetical protein